MQTRMPVEAQVVKVDDYTVDFVLEKPGSHFDHPMGYLVHHGQEMGRGKQLL